jgi:uncharacterized protein (TIGR00730 family)
MKTIVVFAGNRYPKNQEGYYLDLAYQMGRLLALSNFSVATGAGPGLMDIVLKGASEAGGETIGVALNLEGREYSLHAQKITFFDNVSERQQELINIGDAFLVLPGGIGTLHEVCDVIVQKKLKIIPPEKKLIFVGDYHKYFIKILNKITDDGFSNVPLNNFFYFVNDLPGAVSILQAEGQTDLVLSD